MNRYYEYFWCRGKTENIELEDGIFEPRPYKCENNLEQTNADKVLAITDCFLDNKKVYFLGIWNSFLQHTSNSFDMLNG